MFYPVFLNLKNRRIVVIGGGEVAERKVESLLATEALIVLISPDITPRLDLLGQEKRIQVQRRAYAAGDCEGATLVFSATDDAEVSSAVFSEATQARALVNTADEPALCDFIIPAVVRQGDVAIAVSTGGTSPGLASQLRSKIAKMIGPEYAKLTELLARARPEIRLRVPDAGQRKAIHYRILNSDILDRLKRNDVAGAKRRLKDIIGS
jgi:siroheme synthase-like protein